MQIRQTVSDFGVLIAIISMVCLDAWFAVPTPKLSVPSEFKVTTFNQNYFDFYLSGSFDFNFLQSFGGKILEVT